MKDACSFITFGEFLAIVSFVTRRDFRDFGNEFYNKFITEFTGMAAVHVLTKHLSNNVAGWAPDMVDDEFKEELNRASVIDWTQFTMEKLVKSDSAYRTVFKYK